MAKVKKRGFASMTPERRKEIATMGGKASSVCGKGHRWDCDKARLAGAKGGALVAARKGNMAKIGRLGGLAKRKNQRAREKAKQAAEESPT